VEPPKSPPFGTNSLTGRSGMHYISAVLWKRPQY